MSRVREGHPAWRRIVAVYIAVQFAEIFGVSMIYSYLPLALEGTGVPIGDIASLPASCRNTLNEAIAATAKNDRITITLALSYSARWELVRMGQRGDDVGQREDDDVEQFQPRLSAGLQVAGGVPLQVGEPADFSTFRIGLFGLDKLGDIDRTVDLPVSQPTSCCFGGTRLDTLYVTSATQRLIPEQLAAQVRRVLDQLSRASPPRTGRQSGMSRRSRRV